MTRLFVSAAVLATLGSCDPTTSLEEGGPLTFEILEVDWVDPPPPPRQILLTVATEKEYPCMNYRIDGEFGVADRTLHVELSRRITIGDICLTAIGPAQYRAALPITDGTYSLVFARGGQTDRYILTVTQAAFEITTIEAHFTRPAARRFPRGG
jgi:hypothetical protein